MKSMTGYGHGQAQTDRIRVEISLRSVNGRFFEPRFHLPREYVGLEPELRKIIGKVFERGTLDIFISRKTKSLSASHKVVLNKNLAKEYFEGLKSLAKELRLRMSASLESIYRLPEVVKLEEHEISLAQEKKALLKALQTATKACDLERRREGKGLQTEMEKLIGQLESLVQQIQSLRLEANEALKARYEQKIKGRAEDLAMDSYRLSQEIVIQLEKSDIDEEVVRLKEHCKHYRSMLSNTGANGKKLDFYTQELLREVNTIGSKSSLSKLTQIVVEAKTVIEKLREQVQNIE